MDIYYVLVTGVFSSGKSSFIQSISETEPVTTERVIDRHARPGEKQYPALDFGRLTLDENTAIYFFGTPSTRYLYAEDCRYLFGTPGIIFMVDSAKPETFREAHNLLHHEFLAAGLPCVVAASRQDHPDAWHFESVRNALKIPSEIPVLPCIAKERETVKPVLIRLFELWSTWGDDEADHSDAESV